jgi:hypothetical protein
MLDNENKVAGMKMAIGGFLSGMTVVTLNEWVAIVTIAYFVLQIGLLVPKYIKMFKGWRSGKQ